MNGYCLRRPPDGILRTLLARRRATLVCLARLPSPKGPRRPPNLAVGRSGPAAIVPRLSAAGRGLEPRRRPRLYASGGTLSRSPSVATFGETSRPPPGENHIINNTKTDKRRRLSEPRAERGVRHSPFLGGFPPLSARFPTESWVSSTRPPKARQRGRFLKARRPCGRSPRGGRSCTSGGGATTPGRRTPSARSRN